MYIICVSSSLHSCFLFPVCSDIPFPSSRWLKRTLTGGKESGGWADRLWISRISQVNRPSGTNRPWSLTSLWFIVNQLNRISSFQPRFWTFRQHVKWALNGIVMVLPSEVMVMPGPLGPFSAIVAPSASFSCWQPFVHFRNYWLYTKL